MVVCLKASMLRFGTLSSRRRCPLPLPEARIPDALPAMTQESRLPEPLAFSVRETAGPGESLAFDGAEADSSETAVSVTYRTPVSGDLDLLGLVNDRLKTQARRYPHPLSNEMDAFG